MKPALIAVLTIALAGCNAFQTAVSGVPVESAAHLIKRDMSQNKVGRILGPHSHESFDASDGSTSCRSYPYGDASNTRYVIVYFQNELAGSATDGYLKPCAFGGDVM